MPAICSVVATLLFLSGSCSYRHGRLRGSPLTTIFRVLVASASKIFLPSPANPEHNLYEQPELRDQVSRTRGLSFHGANLWSASCFLCWCLEKAAIMLPNQTLEEQKKNRWRLCRVTEVEKTKAIFRMLPMWVTSLMYGVVSSLGNTNFLAQANTMDTKVGKANSPLLIFLLFSGWSNQLFAAIYLQLAVCFISGRRSRMYVTTIGIAFSLIFAVLCCITAAKVESQRLNAIMKNGLLDKPEEKIPMSMFRLVPQYILLGAADGIYSLSISFFITRLSPPSMGGFLAQITNGVAGLGAICSVLTVFGARKLSERGGKLSWFQDSLNRSRLDNYYWSLAALSAVNLLVYMVVAICYHHRSRSDAVDEDDDMALMPMEALIGQIFHEDDDA